MTKANGAARGTAPPPSPRSFNGFSEITGFLWFGYEIPFTRHFYKYKALRPLAEIEAEIRALETEIQGMLGEALS